MNVKKTLITGSLFSLIGILVQKVAGVGLQVVLARFLAPGDYGLLNLGIGLFVVAASISNLGYFQGLSRFVAFYKGKGEYQNILPSIQSSFSVVFIISLITALLIFLFSKEIAINFFHDLNLAALLKIFSFCIPFFALTKLMNGALRGLQKIQFMIITDNFIWRLFPLLAIIVLYLTSRLNLQTASISFVLTTSVMFIVALFLLRTETRKINHGSGQGMRLKCFKEVSRFSLPLSIFNLTNQLRSRADLFLLGFFLSSAAVGLYSVASNLVAVLTIFMGSITTIFTPVISELYSMKQITKIEQIYQLTRTWLFLLVFPIFLFILFFSETAISILFGHAYRKAAIALMILSIGALFQTIIGPVGSLVLAFGKSKIAMQIDLISVVISIGLNIIFIPLLGLAGAATACSLALMIQQLLLYSEIRKNIRLRFDIKSSLIYSFYCLLIILAVKCWVTPYIENIYILVGISFTYYIVCLTSIVMLFISGFHQTGLGNSIEIFKFNKIYRR